MHVFVVGVIVVGKAAVLIILVLVRLVIVVPTISQIDLKLPVFQQVNPADFFPDRVFDLMGQGPRLDHDIIIIVETIFDSLIADKNVDHFDKWDLLFGSEIAPGAVITVDFGHDLGTSGFDKLPFLVTFFHFHLIN